MENMNDLKKIERVGILQIINYLFLNEKELKWYELRDGVNASTTALNNSLDVLNELALIQERREPPQIRYISLTNNGKIIGKSVYKLFNVLTDYTLAHYTLAPPARLDDMGLAFRILFYLNEQEQSDLTDLSFEEKTRDGLLASFQEHAVIKQRFFRSYNLLKLLTLIKETEKDNLIIPSPTEKGKEIADLVSKMSEKIDINELNVRFNSEFIDDPSLYFTKEDDRREWQKILDKDKRKMNIK